MKWTGTIRLIQPFHHSEINHILVKNSTSRPNFGPTCQMSEYQLANKQKIIF